MSISSTKKHSVSANIGAIVICSLLLCLPRLGWGQSSLLDDGQIHRIDFSGQFVEFQIPPDYPGDQIQFFLRGGDGGRHSPCVTAGNARGGVGAKIDIAFPVNVDNIQPGDIIRFIVGERGENVTDGGLGAAGGAGGGGGTAILLIRPGVNFGGTLPSTSFADTLSQRIILAVAGGGGGGRASIDIVGSCFDRDNGQGATSSQSGSNREDNSGGSNGNGGESNAQIDGGGGGGAFSAGGDDDAEDGNAGGNGGANGGFALNSGGWGYGSGGAGRGSDDDAPAGGGGGYSGGAAGDRSSNNARSGGGGGSFRSANQIFEMIDASINNNTASPNNGHITYSARNSSPIMACRDTTITVSTNTSVTLTALELAEYALVEAGEETVSLRFVNGDPTEQLFDCSNTGEQQYELRLQSSSSETVFCTGTISVHDNVAPVINCLAGTRVINVGNDNNAGSREVVVSDMLDNSNDACGTIVNRYVELGINWPDNIVTCADVGSTITARLWAEDNNNNSSFCTRDIQVVDNRGPEVSCMDVSAVLDASGNYILDAALVDDGSFDHCGVANRSVGPAIFDCSDLGNIFLDVGASDAPASEVESGFGILSHPDVNGDDTTPLIVALSSLQGGVNISAEVINTDFSNRRFRDRGTASFDEFTSYPELLRDWMGSISGGQVRVIISGLAAGTYSVRSFHHDRLLAPGRVFDIRVNDALGNNRTLVNDAVVDVTGDQYLGEVYNLESDGVNDIVLRFVHGDDNSVRFNGLQILGAYQRVTTLAVTDPSGNTNTCLANVGLRDLTPPTIICGNLTVDVSDGNPVSISPSMVYSSVSDACGGTIVTDVNPTVFDCSDLGAQQLLVSARDLNGNLNLTTCTVSIVDNLAPTALCRGQVLSLDESGMVSLTPQDLDNGSFDACGIVSMSASQTTFDCSDLGVNPVVLQVLDQDENIGSCNSTVRIQDQLAPELSCEPTVVNLDAAGNGQYLPIDLLSSLTDNCGPPSLVENSLVSVDCESPVSLYFDLDNIAAPVTATGYLSISGLPTSVSPVSQAFGNVSLDIYAQGGGTLGFGSSDPNNLIGSDYSPVQAPLLQDFLRNNNSSGGLRLVLNGLPAGTYNVTSFHHQLVLPPLPPPRLFDLYVDDANGNNQLVLDDAERNLQAPYSGHTYSISSNGSDPVEIRLEAETGSSIRFNGLIIDGLPLNMGYRLVEVTAEDGEGNQNTAVCRVDLSPPSSGVCDAALPLEWLDFQARIDGADNQLDWTTASEVNVSEFMVERSSTGRSDWIALGRLPSRGSPNTSQHYTFRDQAPAPRSYYRIRSRDYDGAESLTEIILLQRNEQGPDLILFPNPTSDQINISGLQEQDFSVRVFNQLRQQLAVWHNSNRSIDLSTFPPGLYWLQIQVADTRSWMIKVVKE